MTAADGNRGAILEIVSKVFKLSPETVSKGISPDTVPGWDSEKHVELVVALEDRFGIMFEPEDVPELVTLEQMEALVAQRSGAR